MSNPCTGVLKQCGDTCVDTSRDTSNCGECGTKCDGVLNGQPTCISGQCGSKCLDGYRECSGQCVMTSTDPLNCGDCGRACPLDPNGIAGCTQGTCTLTCNTNYESCGTRCVDKMIDHDNCGTCNKVCKSNEYCGGGKCLNGEIYTTTPASTLAVELVGNRIFWGDGQLVKMTLKDTHATTKVTSFQAEVKSLVVDPSHVYVGLKDGSLHRIDKVNFSPTQIQKWPDSIDFLAADDSWVFVASYRTLFRYNKTDKKSYTLLGPGSATFTAISSGPRHVFWSTSSAGNGQLGALPKDWLTSQVLRKDRSHGGVAGDEDYVYFGDAYNKTVRRTDLFSSEQDVQLDPNCDGAKSLVLTDKRLYYVCPIQNEVRAIDTLIGNVNPVVIGSPQAPVALQVDSAHVYWASQSGIARAAR